MAATSSAGLTAAQAYQLLNKTTAAKRETAGFNLDAFTNPTLDSFVSGFDQVQVKSGAQQIILQRAVDGNAVKPQSDLNANGVLQIVPDVGAARTNLIAAQNAATPTISKIALPVGIGVAALVLIIFAVRHG